MKEYRKSSFMMESSRNNKIDLVSEQSRYEEDEEFDDDFSPSEKLNRKTGKPYSGQNPFSKLNFQTKYTDQDTDSNIQKIHKTPLIFKEAKFVMKPLDQFLEEQQKDKMSNSLKLNFNSTLGKDKGALSKNGSHHIPLGFGKQTQSLSSINSTKIKQIFDLSPTKQKSSHSQKNENNFAAQSATIPTITKTDSSTIEEKESPKIKNIFNDNIDLKSSNVTPLFDTGPRYDQNKNLLSYSIVGKPEWYQKIDQQKNGSKLTHMNMKNIPQNRNASGLKQQNFDMKSVLSKARKTNRVSGDGGSTEKNGKSQTVTKDHLLMKYNEIENRVLQNQQKQYDEQSSMRFQERLDETRQLRSLNNYDTQREKWLTTAQTLIAKQDPSQALLGKGALAQKSYKKYKNYTRQNIEDTLLMRSEDTYRAKKEQGEYLEHLKDPFEYLGQKNLWEGMLRNDAIDITTKYSQRKRLDDYFFSKSNDNQQKQLQSHNNLEQQTEETLHLNNNQNQVNEEQNQHLFQKQKTIQSHRRNTSLKGLLNDNQQNKQNDQFFTKSILKTQGLPRSTKVDLTFRKSDYTVRELSYTHGVRIQTALNHENLEMIRTPRCLFDTNTSTQNNTLKNLTFKDSDKSGFHSSRGLTKTFNISNYFLEKEKEQTSKYGSIMKQPYLDYFTQSEADYLAIHGESKLHIEKNSLLNDGKQRSEAYQLINLDLLKPKKDTDQSPVENLQLQKNQSSQQRPNSTDQSKQLQNHSFVKQSNISRMMLLQQSQGSQDQKSHFEKQPSQKEGDSQKNNLKTQLSNDNKSQFKK
ncbi:hypothetical protein TTHERM_00191560 (macronuclear) [Tetrahymena thermophila SB210]|uniref:Uncharacterized protein n=1 Tax=Tetrahymena thermophila (strain SB210) TaxID=312017 RepID=I7M827_TETTS|nr:hypothetical protein TTHERM_00191560 [Tetrahymena thermophila SB210]EAR96488.3 hypothetical protein TTHERM_00191560 [Tetrahymena thermophila SB210]|eukprot:XP_001016733.3 hypothetical protein TTHERM_00191560 [Tetrahymena thermophila SB210]